MRVMWPDFPWQQDPTAFMKKREAEYQREGRKKEPLEESAMRAVRWYWNQLGWREDEEEDLEDKGVSWRELAIDCWAASGCVVRCPLARGRATSCQQMAEAFAKASRHIEAAEREAGRWLWNATVGRTSSLAPFGQRSAVTGLKSRPLLLMSAVVGRVLCRAAARVQQGEEEEKVEDWRREEPPTWRRWRDAADELRKEIGGKGRPPLEVGPCDTL